MSVFNTQSHVQPALLGKMNEQQVLRIIQWGGPASRADVARLTGISAPTVSKAVGSLLESGYLEEEDDPTHRRGRPAKRLRLARETSQVIGIVIDVDTCSAASATLEGDIDAARTAEFATPGTYEQLLDRLVSTIDSLTQTERRTLGIGISMPGLIDRYNRVGTLSPNVPITNQHNLEEDLRTRVDVENVVMIQEADCLLLAERYFHPEAPPEDFAMLDITSGIGMSVMTGGNLLRGESGFAGEIGHVTVQVENGRKCGCGNTGCLETVASDTALLHMLAEAHPDLHLTRAEWFDRLRNGSVDASAALDTVRTYLGVGIGIVVNLFNPALLCVHGDLLGLSDDFLDEVLAEASRRSLGPSFEDCTIVRAKGNKQVGAVAGIVDALVEGMAPAVPPLAVQARSAGQNQTSGVEDDG